METGKIVSWAVEVGQKLEEGDVICEVETDKATVAFETIEEGYIAKILVEEGTEGIPLGDPICVFVTEEDDVAAFENFELG